MKDTGWAQVRDALQRTDSSPATEELAEELRGVEARIRELVDEKDTGLIDHAEYVDRRRRLNRRLDTLLRQLGEEPRRPRIVEAKGVRKTYWMGAVEVQALCGVDLQVVEGEMVAVVGPSGCGKTTLLNTLSGLDDIDSGEVWIAGEEIHRMSDRRLTAYRGSSMGFIFQTFNLIPVFSAVENVELPLLLVGTPAREARERAADVLGRVGLQHRLHHRPSELSGGEQQRVAVARALAPGPKIIWADEPTGNLDSATAARIMDLLTGLNEEGLTLILVTHNTDIAAAAPRLLSMQDGLIVSDEVRV